MDERIFHVIITLIPVLGTIVTAFIIPFIKEKIGTEKLNKYKTWAEYAVKCAEMLWTESGHGEDKKQYVVDFLSNMFNSKKTVITDDQINVLIEACVQEIQKES